MNHDAKERLALELANVDLRIEEGQRHLVRRLRDGAAWRDPNVVTLRQRLAAALTERNILVRLLGGES